MFASFFLYQEIFFLTIKIVKRNFLFASSFNAFAKDLMDKNQAPLKAQSRSTDLFSDSNSEILNTTQAASICGVSYHKFLREFGEIPYSFVYPGGPRIYMRSEVRAFMEGKNK